MTNDTRAEPCPFCGRFAPIHAYHHMFCHNCGAEGPGADEPTKESATEAWNRRAPAMVELRAENDRMQAAIIDLTLALEQARAEGLLAMQASRRAALAEAAKLCDSEGDGWFHQVGDPEFACRTCAERVRALADEGVKP